MHLGIFRHFSPFPITFYFNSILSYFSLHENLMKLQQQQIDQLANWLGKAEARIESVTDVGNDIDAVKKKVEEHKVRSYVTHAIS